MMVWYSRKDDMASLYGSLSFFFHRGQSFTEKQQDKDFVLLQKMRSCRKQLLHVPLFQHPQVVQQMPAANIPQCPYREPVLINKAGTFKLLLV